MKIYNKSKYNEQWDTSPLNKLGEFKRGKSKHRPRNDIKLFVNGKYPFIQTGEIKSSTLYLDSHETSYNDFGLKQSKIWEAGTLCITIAANIAETAILKYPMCFPDSIVGFTAYKNKTLELFMHYIFSYIKKNIQNSALGSIQDNINIEILTSLIFKIPNISEQEKILNVLLPIDRQIDLNIRINKELEAIAKDIFNYWFVQFDFPNEEGKPYKTSGGEMIYNEELKRVIPRDWVVAPLSKFTNKNAIPCKDDEYKDCEIIDLSIMHSNSMSINNRTLSGTFNTNLFRMKKYDILFGSIRAYLRKAGIAPFDGAVNGTIHSYLPKKEYNYSFLVCSLINETMFKYAIFHSKGTKMPVIESDELLKYKIPYSKEVSILFNKKVFTFWNKIISNVEQNHELIQIRDFLLPLLMNGQVKIK